MAISGDEETYVCVFVAVGSAGSSLPPHQMQDHPHGHQAGEHSAGCGRAVHQEAGGRGHCVAEGRGPAPLWLLR